jgi:two-component sensor histidine kinase
VEAQAGRGGIAISFDRVLPDPRQLCEVRRFLRTALHDAPEVDADMAVLLANELATNAVLHGRTEFDVRVRITDGRVWVGVHDDNTRPPVWLDDVRDSPNGHGLQLVAKAALHHGVDAEADGKVVWFEMAR